MNKMNKLYNYPAIFYKEDNGGYSVIFPDINNGTATQGDNLEDALAMAIDCLAVCLHGMFLDGEQIPEPTELNNLSEDIIIDMLDDPHYDKSRVFINIISVNVAEYAEKHFNKSVKKMVTIPGWMADMAESKKLKLSKILQDALKEKLQTT